MQSAALLVMVMWLPQFLAGYASTTAEPATAVTTAEPLEVHDWDTTFAACPFWGDVKDKCPNGPVNCISDLTSDELISFCGEYEKKGASCIIDPLALQFLTENTRCDVSQSVLLDNYEVKTMGASGKVQLCSKDELCTCLTLEAGKFYAVAVDEVTGEQTKLNQFNIAQLDKTGWTAVVEGGMTTLELVATGHSGLTGITVTYIYEACGPDGSCLTAGGKLLGTNQVELTFEATGLAEWSEGADAVNHEFTFKESAGCEVTNTTITTQTVASTTLAPVLDQETSEATVSTATPQVTTATPQAQGVSFGLEFVVDFDPSAIVNGVEIEATISNSADETSTDAGTDDTTVDLDDEDEDGDEDPEESNDGSTKTTITFGFLLPLSGGEETTSTDTSIDTIIYDPTITYTAVVENESPANDADTAGPLLSLGFLGLATALALTVGLSCDDLFLNTRS